MIARISALIVALFLSGCGDPITKFVNEKFPPVDVDAQRKAAIDSTALALGKLTTPNIAVAVRLADAQIALYTEDLRKQGVTEIALSGNDQLIYIRGKFSRQFVEADGGNNQDVRKLLANLRPKITGSIQIYAGVTGAVATNTQPLPELQLRLLPGLARVEVDEIIVAGKVDVSKVGEMLAGLLTKYRDNITGELTREPLTRLAVPAVASKPFDFSQSFKVDGAGTAFKVNLSAQPVTIPVKLEGVAWLVSDSQLTALVQLSPVTAASVPAVTIENNYNAINHQFEMLIKNAFGLPGATKSTWVAVRKDLIATTINSTAAQGAACVSVVGNSHNKTESKIELPSGDGISCSSDRNCESNRVCSFSANRDERSCSACILSRPVVCSPRICVGSSFLGPGGCTGGGCTGGGCVQMGNDLVCEGAKAAQNQLYLVDANLRKADCDRLRAMETAGCQAEELGKIALCETGKVALNALRKTGNFANVDVESNLHSDNLTVCLRDFSLAPGLERVSFALDVTGQAKADVDVKFVPLDIVGHLACQFPWKERKTFSAKLIESRVRLDSGLSLVTAQDKARLDFAVDETTVKAKLSPSPIEVLLTSTNMTLSCQGLNLLKPLAINLTPFIKELRGEIDHKVEKQKASVDIPMPVPTISNLKVQVVASQTPQALVLTGTVLPNGVPKLSAK